MKTLQILIAFLIGIATHAQHITFSKELKLAFSKLEELKIKEAESLIQSYQQIHPQNRAASFLRAASIELKLFISESEDEFDALRPKIEEEIKLLEEVDNTDQQKRFLISQLRLGMAILHGKYKNNVSAGWQFYKAYNLLKENHSLFENYAPNYVPYGVLLAAVGSLPDDYQSVASIVGIKGDIKQGMLMLKQGYDWSIKNNDTRFYKDYFGFVYAYMSLELNESTDISPESLGIDYKKSAYLIYMQSLVEVQKGNARKALTLLKNRPQGEAYQDFQFLDYYTGKIALGFSVDTAKMYLNQYLNHAKTDNYKKSTYRYLSWVYMLQDDWDAVKAYRKKVLNEGVLSTGADKQAYREVQKGLNEVLVKGRIWFDAGLYDKAALYMVKQAPLFKKEGISEEDKVEYHYRLGRIYQEKENYIEAKKYFKNALAYTLETSTFSEANSALQLAFILEKMELNKEALYYFKKTLTYKGFPFYEGVHQKAKAGINRVSA